MKVSYGFVFYFQLLMIGLTVSLFILYFKSIRDTTFNFFRKYKLG